VAPWWRKQNSGVAQRWRKQKQLQQNNFSNFFCFKIPLLLLLSLSSFTSRVKVTLQEVNSIFFATDNGDDGSDTSCEVHSWAILLAVLCN